METQHETREVKHTPGPWFNNGGYIVTQFPDGTPYFTVADASKAWMPSSPLTTDEALANARLITAAPEMLEVLKHAHDALCRFLHCASSHAISDTDYVLRDELKRVIEKAEAQA